MDDETSLAPMKKLGIYGNFLSGPDCEGLLDLMPGLEDLRLGANRYALRPADLAEKRGAILKRCPRLKWLDGEFLSEAQ